MNSCREKARGSRDFGYVVAGQDVQPVYRFHRTVLRRRDLLATAAGRLAGQLGPSRAAGGALWEGGAHRSLDPQAKTVILRAALLALGCCLGR